MKTKLIMMAVCLALISGCAMELTPRQRLRVTQDTFTGVVNTLNILKEAGKFDEDEMAKIVASAETGDALMDKYEDAIIAKQEPPDILDNIYIIIGKLLEYKLKGQADGQ